MPVRPKIENFPKIRSALKLYRVTSIITGTFLLLLVVMMVFRYGFTLDIEFTTAYGFQLNRRELITGFNVSIAILTAHGWFYVLYLFSDFRVWSLMRWNFVRFILIALGGVIPFLSFIVERHYHRLATRELAAIEAEAQPTVEATH
jgi:integral membrane protein